MNRAINRHYTAVWKAKSHLKQKCRKPKCTICHCDKVFGRKSRQIQRADSSISLLFDIASEMLSGSKPLGEEESEIMERAFNKNLKLKRTI